MGNCQAIDAAALVIQHPNGRMERMYWSVTASEIMKLNPGHHVSLIIPLPPVEEAAVGGGGGEKNSSSDDKTVRFTRVKLLRPDETLVLGRAYRLVTTQEVMKVLKAKKYAKMKRNQAESMNKLQPVSENQDSGSGGAEEKRKPERTNCQVTRRENHHPQRSRGTNLGGAKSKSWKPSLQSISEAAS